MNTKNPPFPFIELLGGDMVSVLNVGGITVCYYNVRVIFLINSKYELLKKILL